MPVYLLRIATAGVCLGPLLGGACSRGTRDGPDVLDPVLMVGELGEEPGQLRHPRALAVDRNDGRFYVVDRSGRIQLFDRDGGLLSCWRLPAHALGQPVGLALESQGTLLVNDSHYQRILRYSPDGGALLERWGSAGTGPGQFTYGRDVAVDRAGNIYAGDYGGPSDRIFKFSPEGRFLFQWGGRGTEPGRFDRPQGMAVEVRAGKEYLLVADTCNHRVQRFELDGRFVSTWGSLGTEPGRLRYPSSVAVAQDGSIYVSEWGNNRLQRFDRQGRPLGTWGRPGRAPGELATPWDVAVGPDDLVYVADYGNHRVQVLRWPPRMAGRPGAPPTGPVQVVAVSMSAAVGGGRAGEARSHD